MMPAYLRLQRTLAKVGPAVIEIPGCRKFNHDLVSAMRQEKIRQKRDIIREKSVSSRAD